MRLDGYVIYFPNAVSFLDSATAEKIMHYRQPRINRKRVRPFCLITK
jgi:hypothetical protein